MTKPFCIGSRTWGGLSKLIEECGEVQQVAGKIIGAQGEVMHFDGSNLRVRLQSELGDLLAAIQFVATMNDLDWSAITEQQKSKLTLFLRWHNDIAKQAAE